MANPILRLGIYILVGFLLVSKSLAQIPKPRTVTAQFAETRTVTGKIVLTEENGQLVPAEKPDLGIVHAGERLKVELNVVNGTRSELVFDRIASNSGQARPDKGRIRPGESIKVSFETQMSSRPRSQAGGNFVEFHCNDGKKGFIFYAYAFATYVGVAQDSVKIPLQDDAPISEARFDVPIVIGGKLKDGDFEVSLDGIDGEFEARIDQLAKKLHCVVKFEEPLKADRRQGQLVIFDLASGFIRETPIVFERGKTLEVLPTYLKFVHDEKNEDYVAVLYVHRNQPTDTKLHCVVESNISGVPITSRVSQVHDDLVRCRLKISSEQLDKLTEVMSESDSESQPSTPAKLGITLTTSDSRVVTTVPFSITGQPAIQAGPIDKLFATDAIKTGRLAMLSLSPFDVYGVTTEEKEFEDEPKHVSERVRFRLSFDREREILIYAVETKPDRRAVLRGDDPTGTESTSYHRFIVNGNLLYDSSSLPIRARTLKSFEQALAEIPQPAYWGVTKFPGSSSTPRLIEELAIELGRKEPKVTLTSTEGGLRVTLRNEEEGNPLAGIWIWEYGLPDFNPTESKRQRIVDGSPSSSLEQTIDWGTVKGQEVPVFVISEFVTIKRLKGEKRKFALGQGFQDTQLAWLSFDPKQLSPTDDGISIHSPEEIKSFIEEGEQKAKRLGQ